VVSGAPHFEQNDAPWVSSCTHKCEEGIAKSAPTGGFKNRRRTTNKMIATGQEKISTAFKI